LALDSGGDAHIAYYDSTSHELMYVVWDGAWSAPSAIADVGAVGETTGTEVHQLASLALDGSGNPHVSFYDAATADLKYASWTGAAWDIKDVQTQNDSGADNSLALDAADNPHISFFEYGFSGIRPIGSMMYAASTDGGDTWAEQVVETPAIGTGIVSIGKYNSIAIDNDGNPAISYYHVNRHELHVARLGGTEWSISVVDDDDRAGPYSDIAVDSGNLLNVSYSRVLAGDQSVAYALSPHADLGVSVEYPGQLDVIPGQTISIPVRVTNTGITPISGSAVLKLSQSDDNVPGGDTLLLTKNIRVNLGVAASKVYTLKVAIPAGTQPDSYYYVAELVDGPNLVEDRLANNTAVSTHTAEVVWKFGTVEGRKLKLKILDANVNLVTFSLSGGGWGEVVGGTDFEQLLVHETTAKSVMKVSTRRGVRTSAGLITVEGPISSLTASTMDLSGNVTVQQGVKTLKLGNLAGGNTITLNSTSVDLDDRQKVAVTLGQTLGEVDLLSNDLALRSLTVTSWAGLDNSITAPSMAKFSVRSGSVGGNITLGGDTNHFALGTVRIKGDVGSGTWDVNGTVNSVRIYGDTNDLDLEAYSLRSFQADSLTDSSVDIRDVLGSLQVLDWDGGYVGADSAGTLKIKGSSRLDIPGDLQGVQLEIDGDNVAPGKSALRSLYVKGVVDGSSLDILGNAGSINVGRFQGSSLLMGATNLTDDVSDFGANQFRLGSLTIRGLDDGGQTKWFNTSQLGVWEMGSARIAGSPVGMSGTIEFYDVGRGNYEYDAGTSPDLTVYDLLP
jgi:hypothetical protein